MTLDVPRAYSPEAAAELLKDGLAAQRGLDHLVAQYASSHDRDGMHARRFLVDCGFPTRSRLRAALGALQAGDWRHVDYDHGAPPEQPAAGDGPDRPDRELPALAITELTRRCRDLEEELRRERLRVNALEAGPGRVAATEEQWTQLWLDRMAMYVDRGRQSPRKVVQRFAEALATSATRLLEELEADQQRAAVEARRQELLAELAKLDPPKRKGDTKTIGGRAGADTHNPATVRAWAKEQGITVNDHGRVPAAVVARWQAAQNPVQGDA